MRRDLFAPGDTADADNPAVSRMSAKRSPAHYDAISINVTVADTRTVHDPAHEAVTRVIGVPRSDPDLSIPSCLLTVAMIGECRHHSNGLPSRELAMVPLANGGTPLRAGLTIGGTRCSS